MLGADVNVSAANGASERRKQKLTLTVISAGRSLVQLDLAEVNAVARASPDD